MKNRKTRGNEQGAVSRMTEESDEARGIRESVEEMEREQLLLKKAKQKLKARQRLKKAKRNRSVLWQEKA